jgi:serine/threonine-protein kinase RsbW
MTTETVRKYGTVQLPNDVNLIPAVVQYANQVTQIMGFSPKACNQIELALEEACVDVIKNAFAPHEESSIDITFLRRPDGIEITIHDMGLPYDPNMAPSYDPAQSIFDQDMEGLGNFLIQQSVNEYAFHNLGIKGKEMVLVKYFDTPCIIEESPPAEPEIAKPPEKKDRPHIDFDIRTMKPEEAIEVCRCIYDSYGYSYANENIYYPERVAAMNESGKLKSAVAVTQHGEMGGHFALIFYTHLPAEVGIAVTKKKFRGQGFARQLGEFLSEEAMRDGLKGLQIKEVTAHPYTQKFCQKLGYSDCGILLGHSPKTLSFKGIADTLKQRNSDVLGFKYLAPPQPVTIYPPPRHREMIEHLYESIGAPVECAAAERSAPEKDQCVMHVEVHALRSLAEIFVLAYGPDLLHALRQELRKLFSDEIRVVELYLQLEHPMTTAITDDLEKMGFIFTGILPQTAMGETLIMQYFNGVHIEYDELVIISDVARELLDYIKSNDPTLD